MAMVVFGSLLVGLAWPGPEAIGISTGHVQPGMLGIGLGFVWIALSQMRRHGLDHFIQNVSSSVFGFIYIGGAIHLLMALAALEEPDYPARGSTVLLCALISAKLGDVFAFFGGRTFGKNKLCPNISPGKTIEGFISCIFGSTFGIWFSSWIFETTTGQAPIEHWWQYLFGVWVLDQSARWVISSKAAWGAVSR